MMSRLLNYWARKYIPEVGFSAGMDANPSTRGRGLKSPPVLQQQLFGAGTGDLMRLAWANTL
jgi:hypothetical protein